jgi:hypothetical protein
MTTNPVSRAWFAVLRWVRLRPPPGHMKMLRDVVDRREEDRLTRESDTDGTWHAANETERRDPHD